MNIQEIDTFLNSLGSPILLEEKQASLFINPVTTSLIPGLGRAGKAVGSYLGGFGKRLFKPAVERFQAGAARAGERYGEGLAQRTIQRAAQGRSTGGRLIRGAERGRELAAQLGGGLGKVWEGSLLGRGTHQLANRNSALWRGNTGLILGRDPLTAAFNVYAGLEGARKGKEVGGWSGAAAGGLAGLGASRAAWAMGDLMKRGLIRDMQGQMLQGRMLGLRKRPGAIRDTVGGWLEKGGRGVEKLFGDRAKGVLVGERGLMQGAVNKLQATANAARKGAINVPGGMDLARTASGGGAGMPALSSLVTVPIGLAAMQGSVMGAAAGEKALFDGYKRISGNMHQRQQRRLAEENYLRGRSPEFQSTGYNPYATHGG